MERLKKSRALRNITRVEYERRRQFGWWVRLMREGFQYQKFFSDAAHRGKFSALRAAKQYRDHLLKRYPKPEHGNMFNRTSVRNTSGGYPGIHKTTERKKGRRYEVWTAGWTLPDGRRITRKFHFSKTGRSQREAKQLAIKARAEGVRMIERMRRAEKRKRKALQR